MVNATATIQSIAEVLNHTYIPSVEDKPLFDLKNSYWYKVLVDIIHLNEQMHKLMEYSLMPPMTDDFRLTAYTA